MIDKIQIGLDLATAISILGAIYVFLRQHLTDKKNSLNKEIWVYFKNISDDLNNQKVNIVRKVMKLRRELDSNNFEGKLISVSNEIIDSISEVEINAKFNIKKDIERILKYYDVNEKEESDILHLVDDFSNKISQHLVTYSKLHGGIENTLNTDKALTPDEYTRGILGATISHDQGTLLTLDKIFDGFINDLLSHIKNMAKR